MEKNENEENEIDIVEMPEEDQKQDDNSGGFVILWVIIFALMLAVAIFAFIMGKRFC